MWEARVCAFQERGKSPFLVLGIFLFRHFHRLLAGAKLDALAGICGTCCRWIQKTAPAPRSRCDTKSDLHPGSPEKPESRWVPFSETGFHANRGSALHPEPRGCPRVFGWFSGTTQRRSGVPERAGNRPPFFLQAPGLRAGPSSFSATRQSLYSSRRCEPRRTVVG